MDTKLQSMFDELAGLEFPALPVAPCPPPWGGIIAAAARMAHHVVTGRVLREYTADLDDLRRCRDALDFLHGYAETCLRLRAAARESMRQYQDVAICSLGLACLVRTLLTKYGLITTRAEGRKTCPFDLSTHSLEAVAQLLENGFVRYAEPGLLRHERVLALPWRRGPRMILHKNFDVKFNHDLPFYTRRGDLRKLAQALGQRVRNLDELLVGARRALFVLDSPLPVAAGGAERIQAALRARYPVRATLLVLSPGPEESFQRTGDICRATYVLPFAGYQWFNEAHYMTVGGVGFERSVVGHVLRCLRELGPGRDTVAGGGA